MHLGFPILKMKSSTWNLHLATANDNVLCLGFFSRAYYKNHSYCNFQQNYGLNMVQYLFQVNMEKISKYVNGSIHISEFSNSELGEFFMRRDLFSINTSGVPHPLKSWRRNVGARKQSFGGFSPGVRRLQVAVEVEAL